MLGATGLWCPLQRLWLTRAHGTVEVVWRA